MVIDNLYLLDKIKQIVKLTDDEIINVYLYGSHVYKTNHVKSDYDLMVVIDNKLIHLNDKEFKSHDGLINLHLETVDTFQSHLLDMKIKELELYFLPLEFIIKESIKFRFKLDISKLRCEISSKSNNSWAKAHKKLDILYEDDYIGLKSLYHSFRILAFGIQMAKYGKIIDFEDTKDIYFEIMQLYSKGFKWEDYKLFYQNQYNQFSTEFKKVAPK